MKTKVKAIFHEYLARQPFNSRVGQFEKGKHTLCIGLDFHTLWVHPEMWHVYLGKKGNTYWEVKPSVAQSIGQHWTNTKGKTVLIVPLSRFKMIKILEKQVPQYRFNEKTNTAYLVVPENMQEISVQLSFEDKK